MKHAAGLDVDTADASAVEINSFLSFYPPPIIRQVDVLRRLVRQVAPAP